MKGDKRKYSEAAGALHEEGDRARRLVQAPVMNAFDQAAYDTHLRLVAQFRGRRRDKVDAVFRQRMASTVGGGIQRAVESVGNALRIANPLAIRQGALSAGRFVRKMLGGGAGIDEDNILAVVQRGHEAAMAAGRYAALNGVQRYMASLLNRAVAVDADRTVLEALDDAGAAMHDTRWMIDRIARTEASVAYNDVQSAVVENVSKYVPGLYGRWTELVNDLTGEPYDSRVAIDSMVMHGQLALPGRVFLAPSDPRLPRRMIGKSWQHPPNRPNDRAVVTPWRKDWGVPGWLVQNGGKVFL